MFHRSVNVLLPSYFIQSYVCLTGWNYLTNLKNMFPYLSIQFFIEPLFRHCDYCFVLQTHFFADYSSIFQPHSFDADNTSLNNIHKCFPFVASHPSTFTQPHTHTWLHFVCDFRFLSTLGLVSSQYKQNNLGWWSDMNFNVWKDVYG